jgi:hypothetical protein
MMLTSLLATSLLVLPLVLSNGAWASNDCGPSIVVDLGFTPESLAIAGVSPSQSEALLTTLVAETELCEAYLAAATAADEASRVLAECADGALSSTEVTQAAAQVQLDSARAAAAEASADLREALEASLTTQQIAIIDTARTSATISVPQEFRVLTLSAEQWAAVECACRAERRAIRCGDTLDEEMQTLLSSLRSDTNVIAAEQLLETNLAAIEQVLVAIES